jgi:hypothetical protein
MKFLLLFNSKALIPFIALFYGLALWFFPPVNGHNSVNVLFYLGFLFIIFIIKAVNEERIYRRETGLLRTMGIPPLAIFLFRLLEKALSAGLGLILLLIYVRLVYHRGTDMSIVGLRCLLVFTMDAGVLLTYSLFGYLRDIALQLKQD